MGGKFHLRLNISKRPIANKYREGKMKRTLKRELNNGELCLNRVKPEETLVEARSGSDVQIDRQIW
ncbi:12658_t:CDS:2, partial [Acaulospora colombiana]